MIRRSPHLVFVIRHGFISESLALRISERHHNLFKPKQHLQVTAQE
jgi:hypothetical protein